MGDGHPRTRADVHGLIDRLLAQPEGKQLEFKRDLSSIKPVLRTLVAFANTSGGSLVIGRDDAGAVVGIADPLGDELRLANAIAHRDYSMTDMPIRLAIYSDRLEIESPGRLPHGMTVEQLKSGMSRPRNRVIARVLRELDVMEAWGSGYRRICESCHRLEHPLLEWLEVGPVIRTILAQHPETRVRSEADVQINVQIGDLIPEDTLRLLDDRQRWFVEQLAARERLRPASIAAQWGVSEKQAYRDACALRELGVVEYVGPRKTGEWRLISG